MAELLGVVAGSAGLVSLAIQLGECSMRVRRLYKAYQEAPQQLKRISDELGNFSLTLQFLERDRQQHDGVDRIILDQCIQTCVRAGAQVYEAVEECERAIKKSKFKGRVLTALGQKSIAQLCAQLERAKNSLAIGIHLYTISHQRKSTSLLLEQVKNNTALLQQITEHQATDKGRPALGAIRDLSLPNHTTGRAAFEVIQQSGGHVRRTSGKQSSRQSWRIRFSPWFVTQLWEISFNIAQSGFDFNLRTCNFVSPDAVIFEACRAGDIAEVRALFSRGEASPFDCSYTHGTTVLAAAAYSRNLQLCRYLVETAGFPVSPHGSQTPLNNYAFWIYEEDHAESVDMYRLLLKQPEMNVDTAITGLSINSWWLSCPNIACLRLVKDVLSLAFSELSWEALFGLAISSCILRKTTMPWMFLETLGCDAVNPQIAQACNDKGWTALHMVADQLLYLRNFDVPATWIDFLQQLLTCGADVHHRNNAGDTPLTLLLRNACSKAYAPSKAVRVWAHLLHLVGIDLMIYGQKELRVWSARYPSGIEEHFYKINSWEFGPHVDDWTVDFLEVRILNCYQRVAAPGSWLPGSWPMNDKFSINTICWNPDEDDALDKPWQWSKIQDVKLYFKYRDRVPALRLEDFADSTLCNERDKSQDDCGTVVRLLQTSSRNFHRPRSHSQPRARRSRYIISFRHWLPGWHRCREDGRLKFPSIDITNSRERGCAKGIHKYDWGEITDYHGAIRRQIRRFQTRYDSMDELRSLPYAAYHPTWKREQPTTVDSEEF